MAFNTKVKSNARGGARKRGVGMASSVVGGKYASPQVFLGRELCEGIGVKEGDVVRLTLGDLRDFGWARIEPGSLGEDLRSTLFFLRQRNSGSGQLRISVNELGDGLKHATEDCPHRIRNGGVEFELPKWATIQMIARVA